MHRGIISVRKPQYSISVWLCGKRSWIQQKKSRMQRPAWGILIGCVYLCPAQIQHQSLSGIRDVSVDHVQPSKIRSAAWKPAHGRSLAFSANSNRVTVSFDR